MGGLDNTVPVSPFKTKKDSSSLRVSRHPHRKRRFHIPPQATGLSYQNYDVLGAGKPTPASPPEAVEAASAGIVEPEALSERDLLQKMARDGLRVCAWILLGVVVFINFKHIAAFWKLVANAWPGFY